MQRIQQKRRRGQKTVVAVSGGFDPVHVGHARMFQDAKSLGDELVVILNNDNWLRKKKGFVFMPERERKELLRALRPVDRVVLTGHPKNSRDMSVCRALGAIRPDIFANGGDRNIQDSQKKSSSLNPEAALCRRLGIRMVFGVGTGGKVQSSSWLLAKYADHSARARRTPSVKLTRGLQPRMRRARRAESALRRSSPSRKGA